MSLEDKTSLFKALKEIFGKSPEEEEAEFTEEIVELVDEGEEKGLISPEEGEMIVNIIQFKNIPVREIMVPRKDIIALDGSMSFSQVVETINRYPHTRYPVYQKDLDHLIGVVHVKDLMRFCLSNQEPSLKNLCREPYVIPENKKVRDLLREFRIKKEQFAIVIDEMGVISGIVTLQDIFQDMLGEDFPHFVQDEEGWFLAEGTTKLDELERFLSCNFPRGNYETISGFIMAHIGRIPQEGERFSLYGIELEILEADNRCIKRIRFKKGS